MKVAIYNTQSGQIKRFVSAPEAMINIQVQDETEEFYLNCPPGMTHIIDNEPVFIGLPLDELKVHKRREINKHRNEEELLPFEYLGKMFDADPLAIKRLTLASAAAQAAIISGNEFNITWTCADNSTIEMTHLEMMGILEAMMIRGISLHEKAKVLKAQVEQSQSVEELEAITW